MAEFINQFHWLRPAWLWALLPLGLALLGLWRRRAGAVDWQPYVAPALLARLLQGQPGQRLPVLPLLALGWLFAVLALAGPTWQTRSQSLFQAGAARVILWDMSLSMYATDLPPSRLDRSRYKLLDLLERWSDGDTALVAYAGEAFPISPLTTDVANLKSLLPALSPAIMPAPGSHPIAAVEVAIALLQSAGLGKGDLLLVTDEVTPSEARSIQFLIEQHPYRLHVLGVGTDAGAPVRLPDGGLLKDDLGTVVVPTLDEAPLRRLSRAAGGIYQRLGPTDRDIDALTAAMINVARDEDSRRDRAVDRWHDAGYWLILPLLPLALLAFRRGVLPLALLWLLGSPGEAWALDWQSLWQTPAQRGHDAFTRQQYDQAATLFESPDWQGSSYYRNGQYEQALQAFSRLDDAPGWYNRGNALAQLGRFDDAIAAYDEALARDPGLTAAEHNKRLLEQLQQQQQQQQQSSGQQGDPGQGTPQGGGGGASSGAPQSGQSDPQAPAPDAAGQPSAASTQQTAAARDSQQQGAAQESQSGENSSEPDSADQAATASAEPLDPQRQQHLQRWLEQVPDDPSLLLRNKMQLEYERRRQQGQLNQESETW